MPKKNGGKTRKFKRRAPRRAQSQRFTGGYENNVSMGMVSRDAFPSSRMVQMSYGTVATLTAPATTGALGDVQAFSLGNLFDPDITNVGHQPYGRDQIASIYHRYAVISAHISCIVSIPSRDGMFVGMKVLSPNDTDTLTGETYAVCAEDPKVRTKQINAPNTLRTRWNFNVDVAKFMGLTAAQLRSNINVYSSLFVTATGPARKLDIEFALADPAGVGGTCLISTVITYKVRVWERTDFGQS